jgi:hypothetical protein
MVGLTDVSVSEGYGERGDNEFGDNDPTLDDGERGDSEFGLRGDNECGDEVLEPVRVGP